MEKRVRQRILWASSLTTALAMAVPSYVAVPLPAKGAAERDVSGLYCLGSPLLAETPTNSPNSSKSTRECVVAWCRMLAVSLSSTKKVLSPGNTHRGLKRQQESWDAPQSVKGYRT